MIFGELGPTINIKEQFRYINTTKKITVGWTCAEIARLENTKQKQKKKNIDEIFERKISKGRIRDRSKDVVKKDFNKLLGIRNWRLMADRLENWKRNLGESRARFGLKHQMD